MNDSDWQPCFAWLPVYVDAYRVQDISRGRMHYPVMWRRVERRRRAIMPNGERKEHWQYRLPQRNAL